MDFEEAKIGMEIMGRYVTNQKRDWGDEENRKKPIGGDFEFGHEKCWINLPRTTCAPDLKPEEKQALEEAGWFFDEENEAWCHH